MPREFGMVVEQILKSENNLLYENNKSKTQSGVRADC